MGYKRRTPKDAQRIMQMQVVKFSNIRCIVRIDDNAYLTDGEGDPPRTLLRESATVFINKTEAEKAVSEARKTHPYRNITYKIEDE